MSVSSCPAGALPVIASEAKQSILLAAQHSGLLRCARNDGKTVYAEPVVALRAIPGTLRPSVLRGCATRSPKGEAWWSQAGSNRRPLACHASALPAELWPLKDSAGLGRLAGKKPEHSSGPISSLLVAADVADDVGNVLVAFFLVGDEGRIVVIIVFDGLVDLDIVF